MVWQYISAIKLYEIYTTELPYLFKYTTFFFTSFALLVSFMSTCRGRTDGEECDCEEYSPPDNPEKGLRCAECNHGRSKHPKSQAHAPISGGGKSSVLSIFRGITKVPLEDARAESLGGFSGRSNSKVVSLLLRLIFFFEDILICLF